MIRKCTAIASIMLLILASATGCAGGKGAEAQTSMPPLEDASIEDNAEDRQNQSAGPEQNTPETSSPRKRPRTEAALRIRRILPKTARALFRISLLSAEKCEASRRTVLSSAAC